MKTVQHNRIYSQAHIFVVELLLFFFREGGLTSRLGNRNRWKHSLNYYYGVFIKICCPRINL